MKHIYVDELFNIEFIINEFESSLKNNDKTEASVVADVVQEYASMNTKRKKIRK